MHHKIQKYPIHHPLLRKYIKFFWEINSDFMKVHHALLPLRNINVRFNLSETPHFLITDSRTTKLDNVFFSGLFDHHPKVYLSAQGQVHMFGICFQPDGFYPFIKRPVSELKNKFFGAGEAGFQPLCDIRDTLMKAENITWRLELLESALLQLLDPDFTVPEYFHHVFHELGNQGYSTHISEFCEQHHISLRTLERQFNKYVGLTAKTYLNINRFQDGLNQLLYTSFDKLSDIAYGQGYFDQMHYIRQFKHFTGDTPKTFAQQRKSILHIGKFV